MLDVFKLKKKKGQISVHFLTHSITYWKTFVSLIFSCISCAKKWLLHLLQTVVLPACVRLAGTSGNKQKLAFRDQWPLVKTVPLQSPEILEGVLRACSMRTPHWTHRAALWMLAGPRGRTLCWRVWCLVYISSPVLVRIVSQNWQFSTGQGRTIGRYKGDGKYEH